MHRCQLLNRSVPCPCRITLHTWISCTWAVGPEREVCEDHGYCSIGASQLLLQHRCICIRLLDGGQVLCTIFMGLHGHFIDVSNTICDTHCCGGYNIEYSVHACIFMGIRVQNSGLSARSAVIRGDQLCIPGARTRYHDCISGLASALFCQQRTCTMRIT
jgi:hypothetical protein